MTAVTGSPTTDNLPQVAKDRVLIAEVRTFGARGTYEMLEAGASPNARTSFGTPAVAFAADVADMSGAPLELLLKAGANPFAVDDDLSSSSYGKTAREILEANNHGDAGKVQAAIELLKAAEQKFRQLNPNDPAVLAYDARKDAERVPG